jgi:hypothetical protein
MLRGDFTLLLYHVKSFFSAHCPGGASDMTHGFIRAFDAPDKVCAAMHGAFENLVSAGLTISDIT